MQSADNIDEFDDADRIVTSRVGEIALLIVPVLLWVMVAAFLNFYMADTATADVAFMAPATPSLS